jgi:hypothetical protein
VSQNVPDSRFKRYGAALGGAHRAALAVGAVATLALILLDALVRDERTPRGDDLVYERMADDPGGTHTFPFAYRVAVPWLVHVLPFGHTFSFQLLAYLCAGAAAGALFLLLRHFEVDGRIAAALAIGMAISPPLFVVVLRQGRNVDAATVLVMVAATLFIVRRQPLALAVTLLLGAFVRESDMFLIPLAYAVWTRSLFDVQTLGRVAAVSAPAVAAYLALRWAIPTVGREQVPGYEGPFLDARWDVVKDGLDDWKVEGRRMFTTYGPLWLAAPFALRESAFVCRGLALVAAALASMTFALDWGRMILLALPVFYVAAGVVVTRHRRWALPLLVAFFGLSGAYAIHMQRSGVVNGIEGAHAPPYPIQ